MRKPFRCRDPRVSTTQPFAVFLLQGSQKLHQRRLLPPVLVLLSFFGYFAFGEGLDLHLQVDLRVDVSSTQRDMAQPAAYRIYVHTRTQQVHGCRVPNDVWADLLGGN